MNIHTSPGGGLVKKGSSVPVNVFCPGCRGQCRIQEQQIGQTVFCVHCGLLFVTRFVSAPRPAAPAKPVLAHPAMLPSNSSPGAALAQNTNQRTAKAAVPVATTATAGDDEEELLPTWDEEAVNAQLAGRAESASASILPASPPSSPTAGPVSSPRMGAAGARCRLDIGASTSIGRVRPRNEDSYLVHHLGWSNRNQYRELALVIVADGLGGHQGGDMASGLCINMIGNALAPMLTGVMTGQVRDANPPQLTQAIDSAIKSANLAIYRRAQADATYRGMASTAAVVLLWDDQVVIGHVGDCRVYHYHNGNLTQVTRDQTLAARMVELGQLTPQQALVDPSRSQVAQAIGLRTEINPAPYQLRLAAGDWLIVACDGLHTHVEPTTLQQVLRTALPAAAHIAHNLVEMANKEGGTDNTTVVAVRCY